MFFWNALPYSFLLFTAVMVMAFFPAWWTLGRVEDGQKKTGH